ncbi:MAG: flagellar export protein FliJ [Planctomycetes bacterium]|nr:flagellar export protein FliJ [Planctomycetota bacterium]
MKRFQFRLARLFKVREIQEEIARGEWQAAEDLARRAEQRVHEILQLVAETNASLRELQASEQLSSTEVLALQDLLERVTRTLAGARRQAAELRAAAERAREPWTALRVELEGLGRLEQRARDAHRTELTRVENAELDQIALERAARRA